MQGVWFDYASALLAAVSALFWALSARVQFPYGYDMDMELREAAAKAGRLNAWAAGFAAVAAAIPALKTFSVSMGWVASL